MNNASFHDADAYSGRLLYISALLIAVTVVFYLPAIDGGFIWDDDTHVFLNPHLFEPSGLWRIWFTGESQQYYPLVYSSFWLEWRLWGAHPAGYHIVNILLHSANAIFVGLILRRLALPWAWAVAFIFALHPVHVESVAWISERKNVLSAFFYLASMLSFLRYADEGDRKWYYLSLFLFIPALLSKTVVCTLPAVLMLILWYQRRLKLASIPRLLPFFILGLIMGLVTVWWEVHQVGASGAEWHISPLERLLLPARIALFYAYKLFLPLKLVFIYPRFSLDAASLLQWLYPAGLLSVVALLWLFRGRVGRGALAGAAFFLITLFPALGFFDVYPFRYSFVADHFQYLASIGVITVASGVGYRILGPVKNGRLVALVIISATLGLLTWKQGRIYKDIETLWLDTAQKNPGAWIAHNNLGEIAYGRGERDKAMERYARAVRLWPDAKEARYNLAALFLERGDIKKAALHFREAVRIRPDFSEARAELSLALSYLGDFDLAYREGLAAVASMPRSAQVRNSFAGALIIMGRFEEAVAELAEAVRIKPDFGVAHGNLGIALSGLGRDRDAVRSFERAIAIDPTDAKAHYNLGVTLTDLQRDSEALGEFKKSVGLDPLHYRAFNNIGNIHFRRGERREAATNYRKALEIKPGFTEAAGNLAIATHE